METDMENIHVAPDPFEPDESNMKELWSSPCYPGNFCEMQVDSETADWGDILDNNEEIVLNDRMMTDAVQSPRIQSEHSYSLMNLSSDLMVQFGVQSEDSKDMDQECFPSVPMATVSDQSSFPEDIPIKQEPPSPTSPSSPETKPFSHLRASSPPLTLSSSTALHPNSLLKQPTTVVLAKRPNLSACSKTKDASLSTPKISIKLEPISSAQAFSLPPTPPSSHSSDSDGSLSPIHASSHPPSPSASSQTTTLSGRRNQSHPKLVVSLTPSSQTLTNSSSRTSSSSLISSQPKGAVGMLTLTDEEKRTLVAEGYPIPQNLPLSKAEERSLKKIRRKIKNKISAQESRRKKKEYMDALEKKVQLLTDENSECKKKIESLEISNKSLLSQLQHLQTLVGNSSQKVLKSTAIQLCNQPLDTRKHKKDDIASCLELCGVPKYASR